MIAVTGAAGFIGSRVALSLAQKGERLILVDKLEAFKAHSYTSSIKSAPLIDAKPGFTEKMPIQPKLMIHMGAITDTGEKDPVKLAAWNTEATKVLWLYCAEHKIPFIYASSAATYGDGRLGFSDDHRKTRELKPLNPYGVSKHQFDLWALEQKIAPPGWWGLKFFNVYGANEEHKGAMASAVFHGFHQIQKTGALTLFRSHNPDYKDGEQARDFITVEDILSIIDFLRAARPESGLYNCGTGRATTYLEMADALFASLDKPVKINWIDTPEVYRAAYQYRTQAEMQKLKLAGYLTGFADIGAGVKRYAAKLLST
jgi:ADP-L-glycero-D-manno-heptose 6-epimerase